MNAHSTTNASEVERIGLQSFVSSVIFTWTLNNGLPLLHASQQLFPRERFLQPAGCRKCFPRVCRILKLWFLHYRYKTTFLCKHVSIVMVPILVNKNMFVLSYNDLKFILKTTITFVPPLSFKHVFAWESPNRGWRIHHETKISH